MDWDKNTDKKYFYATISALFFLYGLTFYKLICHETAWYSAILITYFTVGNILSFYKVSLVDPGYIRENKSTWFDLESMHFGSSLDVLSDSVNNARKLIITDNDNQTTVYVQKYCICCNIFRPSKASHCSECNRCILEKDHHCMWLDTCIGRNNFRHFVIFITTTLFLTASSLLTVRKEFKASETWIHCISLFLLLSLVFVIFLLIFCLFLYNTYLGLINTSSRDFLNQRSTRNFTLNPVKMLTKMCQIKPLIVSTRNIV